MATENEAIRILGEVVHPEIDRNLVELGMVRGATTEGGRTTVTLAVPFKEIPIKEELERRVRKALSELDNDVEVDLIEMSQRERAAFMAASEKEGAGARPLNHIRDVIAVLSGKGGVGKSSVAALLGVALSRSGNRVGILDADITGPSQPKLFGLHQPPTSGPSGMVPPTTSTGIRLISINLLLPTEDQAVIWRGPLISNVIKQFWNEVAWGELDYLIVDLPPGTSDASLTVMQSIPLSGVVLVTSPQDLAGMVVRKSANMAGDLGAPILGLIENMSYAICSKCGEQLQVFGPSKAANTATLLDVPMLGRLPLDPALALHSDAGEIETYDATLFEPIVVEIIGRIPAVQETPSR